MGNERGEALEECATTEWWVIGQGGEWSDATHPEMTLHHWQKHTGSCWSRRNRGLVSLLTRTSGAFHRLYSGVHSTLKSFVWIECHRLKAQVNGHGKAQLPVTKDVSEFKRLLIIQGTSCELLGRWTPGCWIAYGFESSLKVNPTVRLQYWSWLTEQYTTARQTDHSSRRRRDYVTDN